MKADSQRTSRNAALEQSPVIAARRPVRKSSGEREGLEPGRLAGSPLPFWSVGPGEERSDCRKGQEDVTGSGGAYMSSDTRRSGLGAEDVGKRIMDAMVRIADGLLRSSERAAMPTHLAPACSC